MIKIILKTSKALCLCLLFFTLISCNGNKENTSEGISNKEEKNRGITKISYYDDSGKLEKTFEYINLCGKRYLNQGWYFDRNGDTLFDKSHFFKVEVEKKVLSTGEQSKITISYKPLLKNTISGFLISKEKLIREDYCNLDEQAVDTIYFVDNKLQFSIEFKDKGHKNLGGYILEISKELAPDGIYSERKVYLSIPLDVE